MEQIIQRRVLENDEIEYRHQSYYKQFVYYSNRRHPSKYYYEIQFQRNEHPKIMPSSYLDLYAEQPILYLLYWRRQFNLVQLIIQPYRSQHSIQVIYNHPPSHIVITDHHLFSFNNQQLCITNLNDQTNQFTIPLIFGPIIEVSPCYTQLNEPGVLVIYFSSKDGYIKRQYSKSSTYNRWQKYINFLKINLDEHLKYQEFKIIIPNLIAIVYLTNTKRWYLYDLNMMKLIDSFQGIFLQRRQQFKVSWGMLQADEFGNDGVRMCISNGEQIVVYDLNVARLMVVMERIQLQLNRVIQKDEFVGLNMIIGGKVIDWAKSTLRKYEVQIKTKYSIFALKLHQNHLFYIQNLKGLTLIPKLHVVNLTTNSNKDQFILKQSTIWLNYFKDIANSDKLQDKLLIPNKYHHSIIKQLQHPHTHSILQNKHFIENREQLLLLAVNKWRQYDEMNALIIFEGHLMIIRRNSMGRLHKISQWQYKFEYLDECERGEMEQINRKREDEDGVDPCSSRGMQERQLMQVEYRNNLLNIKKYVQFEYDLLGNDKDINEFTYGVLKDKIISFCELIKYSWNVYHKQQPNYFKNIMITKVLNYLYHHLTHSYHYFITFSTPSLVDLLLQTYSSLFTNDIEINASIFFKIIFQNILPSRYTQSTTTTTSLNIKHQPFLTNQYLQFIITLLIDNQSNQAKVELLQQELRMYFELIFDTRLKEYLSIVYSNSSLIQAYLLIHPKSEDVKRMYGELLKRYGYEDVVKVVCRVGGLIGEAVDCLFQVQLEERNRKHLTKIFLDQSWNNSQLHNPDPHKSQTLQQKQQTIQLAKSILLKSKLNPIRPTFQQHLTTLKTHLTLLQTSTIQQYVNEHHPKLNNLIIQILPFQISNYNYQNILEINEYCLMYGLRLFNRQFYRILEGNVKQFVVLVVQLEQFYYDYKKYYNRMYSSSSTNNNKTNHKQTTNLTIDHQLYKNQQISSNKFLKDPFILLDTICSQLLFKLLKEILSSSYLHELLNKYKRWNLGLVKFMQEKHKTKESNLKESQNKIFVMKFIEEYLKIMLKEQKITSHNAAYVGYYLIKKGRVSFKRLITKRHINDRLLEYFNNKKGQIVCRQMAETLDQLNKQFNQMESGIKMRNA